MVMRTLAFFLLVFACCVWQGEAHASASPSAAMSDCGAWRTAAVSDTAAYSGVGSCTDLGPLASPGVTGTSGCNGAPNPAGTGYVCIAYHSNYGGSDQHSVWSYPNPACPAGQSYDTATHQCKNPCSTDAAALSDSYMQVSSIGGSLPPTCSGSCQFVPPQNGVVTWKVIDGSVYIDVKGYVPAGATCSAGVAPNTATPPPDSDGDGVSDGNDPAPHDPGIGTPPPPPLPPPPNCGTAGNPPCPNNPNDPNGNHSSGGGDCNTPPSSSGDETLAQIAFQTWATRCALTKQANGGPGAGGSSTAALEALQTATNAKLDAMTNLSAALNALHAAGNDKLDAANARLDIQKAATDVTNASLASLDAHNQLMKDALNLQLQAMDAHRTAEITATTDKINAFKDANKASIDATNAAIAQLQMILDDEAKSTNIKIDAVKGVVVDASGVAHSDAQAAHSDAQAAHADTNVAHDDAAAIKDAINALSFAGTNMGPTNDKLDTANQSLASILAQAQAEVDAQGQGNGLLSGIETAINKLLDGFGFDGPQGPVRPDLPAEDVSPSDVVTDITPTDEALDTSGMGLGGACPTIPSFQFMGQSITFDTSPICSLFGALRYMVLLLASLISLRILSDMPGLGS